MARPFRSIGLAGDRRARETGALRLARRACLPECDHERLENRGWLGKLVFMRDDVCDEAGIGSDPLAMGTLSENLLAVALKGWMRANLDWSLETGRFAVEGGPHDQPSASSAW